LTTILVFRIGQLGDSLASLPALRAIRAAHPDARLVLLTDRHVGSTAVTSWEVLGSAGLFDDVVYLRVPSRLRDFAEASRKIRRLAPSRLYYLPPMPRSRWQAARDWVFFRLGCGIRDLVGLRATGRYPVRDRAGNLLRLEKESDRLLAWISPNLPRPISSRDAGRIRPGADVSAKVARLIDATGVRGHRLVAVCPGSKMQATRWPEDRFEEMGRRLLKRFPDAGLLVLGAPHERPLGDRLCAAWGSRAKNFAGDLTIWESAAALERCHLYVGNDTGTMHLAASVGIPCVAIFGARDNPGKWEPAGEGHTVLRHHVPCAGCVLTVCVDHDLACLKGISVDQVVGAASARLAERKAIAHA
jgi:heptosyltransferase-3